MGLEMYVIPALLWCIILEFVCGHRSKPRKFCDSVVGLKSEIWILDCHLWSRSNKHSFKTFYGIVCKGKGKGLPQQAWTGPRGSRHVKAPDFLDVRHYEGGRSSALRTGRLYPRRNSWYSILEAVSTQGTWFRR